MNEEKEFQYPPMKNGLELTEEFKLAYRTLEETNDLLFLTGNAGSGKSTFLRYWLSHTKKKTVVLSPTGLGALNLLPIKASTIHKYYRLPPKPLVPGNVPRISKEFLEYERKKHLSVDTIIIDECSMVSSLMLQAIDWFYRINFDTDEPFGGIQLVLVGDLAQLPPVIASKEERQYVDDHFKSRYFFDATILEQTGVSMIKLTNIFRQKDPEFINILNKIRDNTISQEDLDMLNAKCYSPTRNPDDLMLCATNDQVKRINDTQIAKLPGDPITLTSEITGKFNPKNCPVDETIVVKPGCKVMCRNNDSEGNWVNGTIGTFVRKLSSDVIIVKIDGVEYEMEKFKFETCDYKYDSKSQKLEPKETSYMKAFPISLAYAITIHKSQGSTYDKFSVDMGRGAFDSGQTYVALSRGTSLDGITLNQKITMRDIIIDPILVNFFRNIETL